MQEGKQRVTVTLDKPLVRRMDDLASNRSDFLNSVLSQYLKNYDEQYKQKLQGEIAERQKELKEIEAKEKQKRMEEEAKQREVESKLAEAFKEIDALPVHPLSCMDKSVDEDVKEIASKHGFDWEHNSDVMGALMDRAHKRKEGEGQPPV